MGRHARQPRGPGAAGLSRFDDRDRAVDQDGPVRDLDHDAPGVDVAGPAAVAQSAELLGTPHQIQLKAAPAPAALAAPEQRHAPVEAAAPVVEVAPDGSGGGGTTTRSGSAAQIFDAGSTAAMDAAAQLRQAEARQLDAIMDEPVARTPVALRTKRKKAPAATATTEVTESSSDST